MRYFKKLVYIEDRNSYMVDDIELKTRKELIEKVLNLPHFDGKIDDFKAFLDTLETMGMPYNEYMKHRKKKLPEIISNLYENFPKIPFNWIRTAKGEIYLYKKLNDSEGYELEKVNNSDFDSFYNSYLSELKDSKKLKKFYDSNEILNSLKIKPELKDVMIAIYKKFVEDDKYRLETLPTLISDDPSVPCFKYVNMDNIKEGPTPAWDEFLSRVDAPDLFLAWIWCLFDPINEGRQVLWLQGNGHDGKSTVIEALSQIYGERYMMALTKESTSSQFFYADVYGKRFVTYGNCANGRLISDSKIQSLTGADSVPIQYKGETSFFARIYARLIVGSNISPEIDFYKSSEKSRIIRLEVQKSKGYSGDATWRSKLVEEGPYLLYRCKKAYEKYCPNRINLQIPDELWEKMKVECSSHESSIIDDFIYNNLIFEDSAFIPKQNLYNKVRDFAHERDAKHKINFLMDDLKKRLNKKGVRVTKKDIDGKRYNVYLGIKVKSSLN